MRSHWIPARPAILAAGLEEPHGLAIKDEFENYDEKEIHHGRLYPNLDELVDRGLLEKAQADRRTNVYSVTRRGTREIAARRDWEDQYLASSRTELQGQFGHI